MPDEFDTLFDAHRDRVNRALERYLTSPVGMPTRLWEAMAYSVLAGGKRFRPIVVLLSAEAVGGKAEAALPAACAVELVHTYSLIHDDLPAMDDDDLRRGRPTCHRAFDEATAILAGDGLHALAFDVLTRGIERGGDAALAARLVRELAVAMGPQGVAIGQAADLEAERGSGFRVQGSEGAQPGGKPDAGTSRSSAEVPRPIRTPQSAIRDSLQFIHRHKTAVLVRAAARMGGLAGGASAANLAALGDYGERMGLAFQIIDDILDVTGTRESLGKSPGKDAAAGKLTYPRVMGLEAARAEAARLTDQAIDALAPLPRVAWPLAELARRLLRRLS